MGSPSHHMKEIDRKTFLDMWDLSGPGGGAEECFMRLPQTEFYDTKLPGPNVIETTPNVRMVVSKNSKKKFPDNS